MLAPTEVSSGDVQRHRLSRAGDRQLNSALHVMATAQMKRAPPGRDYYQRKRASGKTHGRRAVLRRQGDRKKLCAA
ncbi:transposase [Plantactinospora alkalitolerans]|uniref:transposase n=1 Tax=Plantactinospora alkalitolerans TaxID=2789879 RepID=UPI002B2208B1|nr:transposase [Plantactinospora alkalitolerans]